MSYCRWSSDGFQCDLYCFEHVGGWFQTYVARARRPRAIPALVLNEGEIAFRASHDAQEAALNDPDNEPVVIGLPYDGHQFQDPTLQAMLDRIVMLKEAGYVVPDWVVNRVREEIELDGDRAAMRDEMLGDKE